MNTHEMVITADGWHQQAHHVHSPNFDQRSGSNKDVSAAVTIELIVIHNISLPPKEYGGPWIDKLFVNELDPDAHPYFASIHTHEVSAHFLIRRDGTLVQYVSCDSRAWHAGQSSWRGAQRCNDFSIGIELEGCDEHPFTAQQYQQLVELTAQLRARYPSIKGVAGHSEIAPHRKTDPGPCFEWARYEQQANIPESWRRNDLP